MAVEGGSSLPDPHGGIPRKVGIDESDEFRHLEGLHEECLGAERHAVFLIGLEGFRAAHKDSDSLRLRRCAKCPEDFDAVQLRHHDVEQHEVGPVFAGTPQTFLAVVRQFTRIARIVQRLEHVGGDFKHVFTDKNAALWCVEFTHANVEAERNGRTK